MTTQIVNLTRQNVDRKIEEILAQGSEHVDFKAFANPDLKCRLVVYVLTRVNNCYAAIEAGQEATLDETLNAELQCHQLDFLIREGINKLLQSSETCIQPQMGRETDRTYIELEPSHWFG